MTPDVQLQALMQEFRLSIAAFITFCLLLNVYSCLQVTADEQHLSSNLCPLYMLVDLSCVVTIEKLRMDPVTFLR